MGAHVHVSLVGKGLTKHVRMYTLLLVLVSVSCGTSVIHYFTGTCVELYVYALESHTLYMPPSYNNCVEQQSRTC